MKSAFLALCLLMCSTGALFAQQENVQLGPLLLGGGNLQDIGIFQHFVDLAGGKDAVLVVIPSAMGDEGFEREGIMEAFKRPFQRLGVENVTILHTRDPEEANTEAFVTPLRRATGVWFSGGRQWRLVDAYAGTKTLEELQALRRRGGVIGGSSAGATIQGEYLARGDTQTNTIMMGDHEEGFAFLPSTAVDQHLIARDREYDLIEIITAKPELLGIGLDENAAIVVIGDVFEVVGKSLVAIYDHQKWGESPDSKFFMLGPGERYNWRTRVVE